MQDLDLNLNEAQGVVPVTILTGFLGAGILTGFLGAGKTTLLNRILNGDHGLRVAVVVNDFGSINVDAELIEGVEDNMISLANGCICCQIHDDLVATVVVLPDPRRPGRDGGGADGAPGRCRIHPGRSQRRRRPIIHCP
jgi:hypothetical protein